MEVVREPKVNQALLLVTFLFLFRPSPSAALLGLWGVGKLQLHLVQCPNANWAPSPLPPERGLQPPFHPLVKGQKGSKQGISHNCRAARKFRFGL